MDRETLAKALENQQITERYRLGRLIHMGMDLVYEAEGVQTQCPIVIKLLVSAPPSNPETARVLDREFKTLSCLYSPYTCIHMDYGQTEASCGHPGIFFLVMEHVEGERACDLLKKNGPFCPADAAQIVLQISKSLAEAHNRQIVHRDVKPENVIVRRENGEIKVKLIDFELGLTGDRACERIELHRQDPRYLPPEFCTGESDRAQKATDVYGLGLLFYELVSGNTPYDAIMDIIRKPLPPLPGVDCPLKHNLDALLARVMAKKPEDRPEAEEAGELFYKIAVLQGGNRAFVTLDYVEPEPDQEPEPEPEPEPEAPPPPPSMMPWVIAIGSLFALAILLVILCR